MRPSIPPVEGTGQGRQRWEFLLTAAPIPVAGGIGSPLNPIATFWIPGSRLGLKLGTVVRMQRKRPFQCSPPPQGEKILALRRRKIIGVMGSREEEHVELATDLGRLLATLGVHLLTGGGRGVMTSVSRSFANTPNRLGAVIGILPCREADPLCRLKEGYPNPWIEIPILTHLPLSGPGGTEPMSRNHINILSSNVVIALPGGLGIASEVVLAKSYKKPVIVFLGSSGRLDGIPAEVPIARSLSETECFLRSRLD